MIGRKRYATGYFTLVMATFLMLSDSGNDPRVPRSEAEQMVGRVRQNGMPVWYLLARDEGHGFRKKENADFQFYATVLFVRQHLLAAPGNVTSP